MVVDCIGSRSLLSFLLKYHRLYFSSFMSAFHIARLKLSTERHADTSEEASTSCDSMPSRRSLPPLDKSLYIFTYTLQGRT